MEIYNKDNTKFNKINSDLEPKTQKNFKWIISKHNINIIFRVDFKLNKIIKLGEDVLEKGEISNIVYKLESISCDKTNKKTF